MSGTSEFLLFEPHVRVTGGRQIEFGGKWGNLIADQTVGLVFRDVYDYKLLMT